MSGSAPYLPNLTGVRGLAALWVLALHAWDFSGEPRLLVPLPLGPLDLTPLVACGYFGVDLFFVLSGFLLSLPFHRASLAGLGRPSLRDFWRHRCRRVLPAYWLQLAILAAILVAAGQGSAVAPRILAAHLLLAQNIAPWPVPLLNPVYWSMPIEWDFYAVLPLLVAVLARCRWWLALSLAVAFAIAFRIACYRALGDPALAAVVDYGDVQQLPARIDQFFIGICAGWLATRQPLTPRRARAALGVGAVVIVAMTYVAAPRGDFLVRADAPYLFFHHTVTAFAFGLIVLGASGPTRIGSWLFSNRAMTFAGLISYSLYLWHYPLLTAARNLGVLDAAPVPRWLVVAGACVPAILFVAWLSYRFVERPFLRSSTKSSALPAAPIAGVAQLVPDEPPLR